VTVQKTHHYHPIVQVTEAWKKLVESEDAIATRTPDERADRDRMRKDEALDHEAAWAAEEEQNP
jgi:hypothetical protein